MILVYILQFCFALLITFPLSTILANTLGRDALLTKPLSTFDFILFSDFINQHSDLLRSRLDQSLLMMGLFLLFYIFLTGGILESLIHREGSFSGSTFWRGAGRHFGKLAGSLILFGAIQGLILLLFIGMIILNGINPLTMESDLQAVRRFQWLIPVFVTLEVIVSMVHDHVKVGFVQYPERGLFQVIRGRSARAFNRFFPAFGLYLIVIGTGLLILFTGHTLTGLIPENTAGGIWIALLISQAVILGRIIMKFVNYASICTFYSKQGDQAGSE